MVVAFIGPGLSDFNFDVRTIDAHIVAADGRPCRRTERGSAGDVKRRPVPWASYFRTVKVAFAQRSTDMGTTIVDGMKRAGYVEESYLFATGFHQFGLAGTNFISPGNFHKLRHIASSLKVSVPNFIKHN
jgi:hypothetical protein